MRKLLFGAIISMALFSCSSANTDAENTKDSLINRVEEHTDSLQQKVQDAADSAKDDIEQKSDSVKSEIKDSVK